MTEDKIKELKKLLNDMSDAFNSMAYVAEENLPDVGDDDGGDDDYINECTTDYNNSRKEFNTAYDKMQKTIETLA